MTVKSHLCIAIILFFLWASVSANGRPSADFNGDSFVDFDDFSTLLSEWLTEDDDLQADADGDGIVNLKDFNALASQWSEKNPAYSYYYIDSIGGSDYNPGTFELPWRTMDKVNDMKGSYGPGTCVFFKRGGTWTDEHLYAYNISGTEQAPITFGAYGPGDSRPLLSYISIGVRSARHIIIRDLKIDHGSIGVSSLSLADATGYIQIINNELSNSSSNSIKINEFVHHTACVDNIVYDWYANDGISIHDSADEPVGSHHWVIDNIFPGNVHGAEDAMDFASESLSGYPAGQDVKFIGNRVTGSALAAISVCHSGKYTWVIGNLITRCGIVGAGAIQATNSSENYRWISGNIMWNNTRPACIGSGKLWCRNNMFMEHGKALVVNSTLQNAVVRQNIIHSDGYHAVVFYCDVVDGMLDEMDYNWFSYNEGQSPCRIRIAPPGEDGRNLYLWQWQTEYGFDLNSHCVIINGLSYPSDSTYSDPATWTGEAFFDHFRPAPGWQGYSDNRGAFDADGNRLGMEIVPFAGYSENDGYGWEGPPIVQERYPINK
ncbi:MAG: hypothetical protein KAJ46_03400 [Sedimentisphaerales bacterium]|nr:hypothetical protein [Sedimentisphaerales bacterium]